MNKSSVADLSGSGIYLIMNMVNNKYYIGSAVKLGARWRQHQCDARKGRHNAIFQNAWNKHGETAFVFTILEHVPNKANLIVREQFYIDELKPHYNVAQIAGSRLGTKARPESRVAIGLASKATWERPGYREKMSAIQSGKTLSSETRTKISLANTGKKSSPEHAAKTRARNIARNQSPEHRAKMSAYWKGRPKTAEQNAKMAATKIGKPAHNRGKPMSDEQKAKQSAAMKAKYEDPAFRLKIAVTTREAMQRPEVIEKMQKSLSKRRTV